MTTPLLFRRAEARDAILLTQIAQAAKQHWGYPDEWMAEWRHDLMITPEYIRSQPIVAADLDGEMAGFAGLSMVEGQRYLEHLWLWPKHIGHGFGRLLFQEAVRMAREAGVSELRIKSDPNAEPFYLKMGAIRIGSDVYLLLGKIRREVPLMVYKL